METQIHSKTGSQQILNSSGMKQCVINCLDCSRICREMIPRCLSLGGNHATREHITLLSNCADICDTSARFIISGSPLHTETCKACAVVCNQCAVECSRMEKEMKECEEACAKCADSCKQMATH